MKISNHAQQRYAERIMDKSTSQQINKFIHEHNDKITDDIGKMIQYGKKIYHGANGINPQPCDYILCGSWVIIYDDQHDTVVTLYKIDLGLGEDFNKKFIDKYQVKLGALRTNWNKLAAESAQKAQERQEQIDLNNLAIEKYKTYQKRLEADNEALKTLIQNDTVAVAEADDELHAAVDDLIKGRRIKS